MPLVSQVADTLLADLAPLDPTAAQALGRQPASLMPQLAPSDFGARHQALVRALTRLEGVSVEPAEMVLAAALRERLTSDIALAEAGFTSSLLAPLATPVHSVREVFDTLPSDDWPAIGAHLRQVPGALRDYASTLRGAARVAPVRQVLGVAEQCSKWVDPGRDDFYRRLVAQHPDLLPAADAASEATELFATFLREELALRAPEPDAAGRELYTVTAQAFLGDEVDLQETYLFGWQELISLTAEMRAVAAELGADSIEAAAADLDDDPERRIDDPERLVEWLNERIEDAVLTVDGDHLDLPEQSWLPECALSPTASGVATYQPPDPLFTRPGRIWWATPTTPSTSTWREVTTLHHEGVPGHHAQAVIAMRQPRLHPWQRSLAHVHGHAEGWAHYAERLADELGLLRDAGERLGMLYGQRWRAARIVIDMGLHLGYPVPSGNGFTEATTWTPEVGVEVLQRAGGLDEATARFEVDRYLGWPAQALAFRVGARTWQQLRDAAAQRPGFTLKRFHMRALQLGPMGLGPLRAALAK
ncbi:MAG TPA: DUF885 domain-containing protein [Jatrophihabitantaceae bacterium]